MRDTYITATLYIYKDELKNAKESAIKAIDADYAKVSGYSNEVLGDVSKELEEINDYDFN